MSRKVAVEIIYATILAADTFVLVSLTTLLISQESRMNFEVGFPLTYYYQFLMDGDVQHGVLISNFIVDASLVWIVTMLMWFGLSRRSLNGIFTFTHK